MIYYSAFFFIEFGLLHLASVMRSSAFRVIACLFAIAFCGLRYETGYDYNSYRSFFEDLDIYEGLLEPGFYYAVSSANFIGIPTLTLFFLFAMVTHGLAFLTITRTTHSRNLAFLLYLLIPGLYLNSFSILRQALAVSIFGWAVYRLITRRNRIEYLALGMLAVSFHLPAAIPVVVAFAIYLGPQGIPSRWASITLLAIRLFASRLPMAQMALGFFGDTKYEFYLDGQVSQGLTKVAGTILIAVFMVWHSKHFARSPMLAFFFKLWLIGAVMFNVFMQVTPLTRISYYFSIVAIPLFVDAALAYRGLPRTACRGIVLAFFMAGFVAALYNDTLVDDPITMLNYKSILEAP